MLIDPNPRLSAFPYRRAADAHLPVSTGFRGGSPEEILEETDEVVIARDGRGRLVKLHKKAATLPLPLEYPVKGMDDWLALCDTALRRWRSAS